MIVKFSKRADRDLVRMKKGGRDAEFLRRAISALGVTGFGVVDVKRLQGRAGKVYRVRFGDVRVLIELQGQECVVLEVVDRKDAY